MTIYFVLIFEKYITGKGDKTYTEVQYAVRESNIF